MNGTKLANDVIAFVAIMIINTGEIAFLTARPRRPAGAVIGRHSLAAGDLHCVTPTSLQSLVAGSLVRGQLPAGNRLDQRIDDPAAQLEK